MGLKRTLPEIRVPGYKLTPDEFDAPRQYIIENPSVDPVWFGTCAVGTAAQAKTLVLINARADYPRNAVYAVAAAAGSVAGGTWSVNGKDQFGNTQTETVAIGTATGGGTAAGTKVWSQMTSGTFTHATLSDPGNGTSRLGVAIGTSTALQHWFGLPDKIGGTSDVKNVVWINNGTTTTLNGGTPGLSVGTATPLTHAFKGSAVVAITDKFVVTMRSSFPGEEVQINNL